MRHAELYRAQGKYSEATPPYERALTIVEKNLGKDHPYVAATRENMAELYKKMGKWHEAERLRWHVQEKSVQIDE
jgi:hypothetical protein